LFGGGASPSQVPPRPYLARAMREPSPVAPSPVALGMCFILHQ